MALRKIRVLELAGLAPVPYCGQVLADLGAEVIRVDRAGSAFNIDQQSRGKKSIALNMKDPSGQKIFRSLARKSDVLLDPFRPGVMERLNCGPERIANERLIFARLSGFGQTGPMRDVAGHDINYLAQSGVLDSLRDSTGKPCPPINLVADFAGGGVMMALGVTSAIIERGNTGKGQVLDLAMSEGAAYASGFLWSMKSLFPGPKGTNMLDGGAPFYGVYETKDGRFMALGAIEPQFYQVFLEKSGLADFEDLPDQMDQGEWENLRTIIAEKFLEKTQAEWTKIFYLTDACVSPVMTAEEAAENEHNKKRNSFVLDEHGQYFPHPVPRSSTSSSPVPIVQPNVGEHTVEILSELYSKREVRKFLENGVVS